MDVDPRTGRYLVGTGLCGLSGPAIRPIALANVFMVAQAVTIPVIGLGGIMTAEDVVSFIRVGAQAVQIGTANYRDPGVGVQIADRLATFLAELGVGSLADIRGQVLRPSSEEALRPSSGEALRPSSGEALRPSSGQALRPSSGQAQP